VAILRSATDPRWVEVALSDLDATLADHAHCEKKAAATALKLVADHPDRPTLVQRRGRMLGPDPGDRYAQGLLRLVRGGSGRLLDQLLVGALIEARSCERMVLLGERLPEARLRDLYRRLARSEAGHQTLFLDLALEVAGQVVARARLAQLAEAEALLMASLPLRPRIH
jgi:tRNA 2-(methylsulfanyl)-N6-isopentenyladenosine37 hydroxylase